MSASPKPPSTLQAAGRGLWRAVIRDVAQGWQLDAKDLLSLEQACVATDRANALERLIAGGLMIEGSQGQERLHPAVSEARLQRTAAAALLARVELAPAAPKTGALSGRQRAELRRMVPHGSA